MFRLNRIAVLLTALFLTSAWSMALGAVDGDSENGPGKVDRERVEEAVASIASTGEYAYKEATFEDPVWLRKVWDWIRRLNERWESSPLNSPRTPFSFIGIALLLLLVVGAAGLLLTRVMGADGSGLRASGDGEVREAGAAGVWERAEVDRAAELASAERFREAVSALFGSLLRGLDSSGWIKYRHGRPSRAYLRQLRRSAELYPHFRDFLARFEIAYYRKGEPDSEDWQFLRGVYGNLARVAADTAPPAYMRRL
jgi:hypothetical protein